MTLGKRIMWREIIRKRTPSQDSDDLICLSGSHKGPGKQLLVGMSLAYLLHCENPKSSLTFDFVKVNKRIRDYNNPPQNYMQ